MHLTFYKKADGGKPITLFVDDIVGIEALGEVKTIIYTKGKQHTVFHPFSRVESLVLTARYQRDKLVEENRRMRAILQNVPVEYLTPAGPTIKARPRPKPDQPSDGTPF